MKQYNFEEICQSWGLEFKRICDEIEISGSPDRSDFRCVLETTSAEKYLLELLPDTSLKRKEVIFHELENLHNKRLTSIVPYLRNSAGEEFTIFHEQTWQLSAYINGIELDRPAYIYESWRGLALADFYRELKNCSRESTISLPFILSKFCDDFHKRLEKNNPELLPKLKPAFEYLQYNLFEAESNLPTSFCHGDLHPVNIIWGEKKINAVIDWEFCGAKLEIYDLANLIGCLGFERPVGLNSEFALTFLEETRSLFQPESMNYLFETILAQRLTWLSDWLRRKDSEMINLEIDYINLLLKYRQELKACWGIE